MLFELMNQPIFKFTCLSIHLSTIKLYLRQIMGDTARADD